ncbi:4'-phosphopantetheinyl transferase superfamily protein [Acidovorax sp.]|uniref:4'-phosphopantetheinyl transferase family protein n=1 Tax=Acidovorax sp. TaxID=1872122 RepID=UPI00260E972C|nr:4'-phosphopantetheinyl transferase superfamily protein [Acidovorax sp.]
MSHSGAYLACATGPQPVGIDLEVRDVRVVKRDVLALAAMACSDWEMRQLRTIDCERSRYRLFLQWWSLKEAYFKCLGTGVNFASIRGIECRQADHGEGHALAQARSWRGKTAADHAVLLSVCVLDGAVPPDALHVDADIEWEEEGGWSLVAVPP